MIGNKKYKDIDLYIALKFKEKVCPVLTQETCIFLMENYLGFEPDKTQHVIDVFVGNAPKTRTLVHGLLNWGYNQMDISEILELNQSGISRHLKEPVNLNWENFKFYMYMQSKPQFISTDSHYSNLFKKMMKERGYPIREEWMYK